MSTTNPWDALAETAKADAVAYEEGGQEDDRLPLLYPQNGLTKFRIYPEKTKTGGIRIFRKYLRHKVDNVEFVNQKGETKTRKVYIRCIGDQCKICKTIEALEKAGQGIHWSNNCMEEGLAYGYVYSHEGDEKYCPKKTFGVFVFNPKQMYAINSFISRYPGEKIARILDPSVPAFPLIMSLKKGSGGNCAVSTDSFDDPIALPPMDENTPPLDDIFITTAPINEEDADLVVKHLKSIAAKEGQEFNPNQPPTEQPKTENTQAPPATKAPETAPTQQSSSSSVKGLPGVVGPEKFSDGSTRPHDAPVCFGARPAQQHPTCLLCVVEPACENKTNKP